jgi:GDP-mannose transporter
LAIQTCKSTGLITYRDFNSDEARKWFPITLLLIGMIYTSTKALQFLSIPVYTIFKNLTIILIAYGEVLWFGGRVTSLALLSFGLMVMSSVIAAWADIQHALTSYGGDATSGEAAEKISTLNAGYMWMMINCFCSATYVLAMRKRIKLTNFKDFDSELTAKICGMRVSANKMHSHVLQQPPLHPRPAPLLPLHGKLELLQPQPELPA